MNSGFKIGMKVSLNGEFGVIVESESVESNFYGIIRWDTKKKNDFEDWRGMFGTFIDMGGKIIEDNYQFKFINDDGTIK